MGAFELARPPRNPVPLLPRLWSGTGIAPIVQSACVSHCMQHVVSRAARIIAPMKSQWLGAACPMPANYGGFGEHYVDDKDGHLQLAEPWRVMSPTHCGTSGRCSAKGSAAAGIAPCVVLLSARNASLPGVTVHLT
jgi:hypothetical protein